MPNLCPAKATGANSGLTFHLILCATLFHTTVVRAQVAPTPAAPQPSAPARSSVELPLERTNYFLGETIPLSITNAQGPLRLELVDGANRVAASFNGGAKTESTLVLRLETARLAPGEYTLHLNGDAPGAPGALKIGLQSPIRPSPAALPDSVLPSPDHFTHPGSLEQTLRESGINAVVALGVNEQGRLPDLDRLAPSRTSVFFNPYSRPMSFVGARVYEPELKTFRHRLALMAQANGRYPTFGGFSYEWDPTGFLNRKMLLVYWGWDKQSQALRNYITRSDQAVYDDFKHRTGMDAPTQTEYLRYLVAIGRPEFVPVTDLPTARWTEEIVRYSKPLPAPEIAALEKRLDAWSGYLMNIYGETYAGHNKVTQEIMPSLRHTASVDMQNSVRDGQWQPSAYQPLEAMPESQAGM